ncbi:inorganic phosphate transporter [Virgibacillus sediminis]|uniref:Anion permease n=1 Tax=Virgibacillus sediminis TaxID=202260 RepID=A0ABV7A9J8_9BACI
MITALACLIAFFFAMNIGASGAAASMGVAYGTGAVTSRKKALFLCGIGVFLGAALGGSHVAETLGSEVVPEEIITIPVALMILVSASLSLFLANLSGIPLSTSEVTVGAVTGVGIAYNALHIDTLMVIVLCWILVPILGFSLAIAANKWINVAERKLPFLEKRKSFKAIAAIVVLIGFLEAISAGMNNVANAVSPLIASGVIGLDQGIIAGGLIIALGAFVLGARVMETNGKKITKLSLLQGGAVSGIGASIVITASFFGIPVPHTQITTSSILGIAVSDQGKEIWRSSIVTKLLKTWVLSPFFSLVISYSLVKFSLGWDWTGAALVLLLSGMIFILGWWEPLTKTQPLLKRRY